MRRLGIVLAALLLVGCPDDVGQRAAVSVEVGLRAPTDLAGVADGGSQVRLTWTDRATNETGYRLEMDHLPFEDSVVAGLEFLPADAAAHDFSTTPNTTYYFRVVAITDTLESAPSNVLFVTTPPAAPEGVVASPTNFGSIAVTWQDVEGEIEYVIERSNDSSPWVEVGRVPWNGTFYGSEPLAPDTTVVHRVIAVGMGGRSSPSRAVGAQTVTDRLSYEYLPTAADNGLFTSLVAPHPGVLHVAHYDALSTSVTFSSRIGTLSPWVSSTADGTGVGGDGTSLAVEGEIGTPQKAHIVAHDRTGNVLRYATNATGAWVRTTLDFGGATPKIARNPTTGALHVAYPSQNVGAGILLRLARRLPGQAWTFRSFGGFSLDAAAVLSLALDGSGRPHVVLVGAGGSLLHAYEDAVGGLASEQIPYPASDGVPDDTSLVIEPGGTIHAFYRSSRSKSLRHLSRAPGAPGWQESVVDGDSEQDLGRFCSAFFDPVSSWLHVAYYDATRADLKCATLVPGGGWTARVIDTAGDVGSHVSVAGIWGATVYFAYRDETRKRLKLAVKQF